MSLAFWQSPSILILIDSAEKLGATDHNMFLGCKTSKKPEKSNNWIKIDEMINLYICNLNYKTICLEKDRDILFQNYTLSYYKSHQ